MNYGDIAKELIAYVKENNFTYELMPLNEYPFDGSWGYRSGYFSATSRYGSVAFIYLINACHRANIGIIMDFVPVHFVRDDFLPVIFLTGHRCMNMRRYAMRILNGNCELQSLERRGAAVSWMSAAAFGLISIMDGLRMDAISNITPQTKDLGEMKVPAFH